MPWDGERIKEPVLSPPLPLLLSRLWVGSDSGVAGGPPVRPGTTPMRKGPAQRQAARDPRAVCGSDPGDLSRLMNASVVEFSQERLDRLLDLLEGAFQHLRIPKHAQGEVRKAVAAATGSALR